jgi:hypothetical protein
MDIQTLLNALQIGTSLAQSASVSGPLEATLNRLAKSDLGAGLRLLEQAANASRERASLLQEARTLFNRAVCLEDGYRKVVAFLGLSVCHYWLEDNDNCAKTLEELLSVNPVTTLRLATTVARNSFRRKPVRKHPLKRLGEALFSKAERREYRRELVLSVLASNDEAKRIFCIQESVSQLISKPIPWLEESPEAEATK